MTAFIFTARDSKPDFGSDYNRSRFIEELKSNEGKQYRIEKAKNPVTNEMRGYYFGAVLPVVRKTCIEWKHLTSDELHEVLKTEFAFFEAWSIKDQTTKRYATNVMSDKSSTQKAIQYLQDISDYLAQCGLTMPDPEEYKRFRDSAPTR